jgi:integrase
MPHRVLNGSRRHPGDAPRTGEARLLAGMMVHANAQAGQFVVYDNLSATVNEIYKRTDVTRPPKPLHSLRHTFGTVMARRVPL